MPALGGITLSSGAVGALERDMQIEGLALVTEKAPQGGYALKQITIVDGHAQLEVIAYKSSLPEINMLRHRLEEDTFRELAWWQAPPQPIAQAPQPSLPQPQQPLPPAEDHFEMPRAFAHQEMPEPDQSLVNNIRDRMLGKPNGRTNIVAFVFCTLVALSFSMRQLVT
jgi:hypothetical protein